MSNLAVRLASIARENDVPIYAIHAYEKGITSHMFVDERHHTVNNIYSVSKTFTAVGVGMLADRGYVSMTDTVYDCLIKEAPYCPDYWKKVTVDHLLSQRTGCGSMYLDLDTDDIADYPNGDMLRLALTREPNHEPGGKFAYSDSNLYIASRLATAVSGEKLQDFMGREMFGPMGYQLWSWGVCPWGYAAGGTGLVICCKDMLKFGIMLLHDGEYEGKQYVSKSWLDGAKAKVGLDGAPRRYGWGIWTVDDSDAVICNGALGQVIFVDPKNDRAVAWQAFDTKGKVEILKDILKEESR